MQNVINVQITKIRVYQIKNWNQNVSIFSNASTILIFEISSQSFDSFLKFNDNFQLSIDSNFSLILSFIQRLNVVSQFSVEFRFQTSSRYNDKIDNNACVK